MLVLAGALLVAGVLVSFDPRLRGLVLHGHWSSIASESNRQRSAMLTAGWLMGCDRPWTGYGPGTVSLAYPRYRARLSGGVDDVLELHNTPAQFWAELGAPGVLAGLLILVGLAGLTRESGRQRASRTIVPADRLRAQAALIAFAGYAAMCLIDYQVDVPLFAAVIAALLVLWRASALDGTNAIASSTVTSPVARLVGMLLLAALAAMLWPTLRNLHARQLFASAADAREAGNEAEFVAGAEKAAAIAPWETFYPTQLAAFYGERYLRASDAATQDRARERCSALLRQVLVIDPHQEYSHFNLGWLLLPKDPANAEKYFRAAARLSPYRGGVYLGIGLSRLAQNERPAAINAFALEWLNDPQAITSPVWYGPPLSVLRSEVAAAVHHLSSVWLDETSPPAVLRDQLRYVASLAAWWPDTSANTATLIHCGTPEQRRFFMDLEPIEQRIYISNQPGAPQPWEQLYIAWRNKGAQADLAWDAPKLIAAINRRLALAPSPFVRLLTDPPRDEPALIGFVRNALPGYSVLQRNQDGFPLSDLYVFPRNLLAERFASFLFPPKGYLPEHLLLRSLDLPVAASP
jgi:tetratricopeptide (TPR) repeat protein